MRNTFSAAFLSKEVTSMKVVKMMLLVGVLIIFAVVFIVSIWVIPRVATDTSPGALPGSATNSFWASVIANVFVGCSMVTTVFLTRHIISTILLVLDGIVAILVGLFVLDGAFSFAESHPQLIMQGVPPVVFACAGGDFLVGILAFIGAALLTRFGKHEPKVA